MFILSVKKKQRVISEKRTNFTFVFKTSKGDRAIKNLSFLFIG